MWVKGTPIVFVVVLGSFTNALILQVRFLGFAAIVKSYLMSAPFGLRSACISYTLTGHISDTGCINMKCNFLRGYK